MLRRRGIFVCRECATLIWQCRLSTERRVATSQLAGLSYKEPTTTLLSTYMLDIENAPNNTAKRVKTTEGVVQENYTSLATLRFPGKYAQYMDGLQAQNHRKSLAALFSVHKRLTKLRTAQSRSNPLDISPLGTVATIDQTVHDQPTIASLFAETDRTALHSVLLQFLRRQEAYAHFYFLHGSSNQRTRWESEASKDKQFYMLLALQEVEDIVFRQLPELGLRPSYELVEELIARWCAYDALASAASLNRLIAKSVALHMNVALDQLYLRITKILIELGHPEMAYLFHRKARRLGQSLNADEMLMLAQSLLSLRSFWAILLTAELARLYGIDLKTAIFAEVVSASVGVSSSIINGTSQSLGTRLVYTHTSSSWSIMALLVMCNLLFLSTGQCKQRFSVSSTQKVRTASHTRSQPTSSHITDILVQVGVTDALTKHLLRKQRLDLLLVALQATASCSNDNTLPSSLTRLPISAHISTDTLSLLLDLVIQTRDLQLLCLIVNNLTTVPSSKILKFCTLDATTIAKTFVACHQMHAYTLVVKLYKTLFINCTLLEHKSFQCSKMVDVLLTSLTTKKYINHLYSAIATYDIPMLTTSYHSLIRRLHQSSIQPLIDFGSPVPSLKTQSSNDIHGNQLSNLLRLTPENLFRRFVLSPFNPSRSLYSSFLSLFIHLRRFDLAENIVQLIRTHHESPGSVFRLDTRLYNTLLHAYIQNWQPESARAIWQQMEQQRLIDVTSYNVLLHDLAKAMWHARRKHSHLDYCSIPVSVSIVNLRMLSDPPSSLNEADTTPLLIKTVLALLNNMIASNIRPDVKSFILLVRIFSAVSFERAQQVISDATQTLNKLYNHDIPTGLLSHRHMTPVFNQLLHVLTFHAQITPSERLFHYMTLHDAIDTTSFDCMLRLYNKMEKSQSKQPESLLVAQHPPFRRLWRVWKMFLRKAKANEPSRKDCHPTARSFMLLLDSHPATWNALGKTCKSIHDAVKQFNLIDELDIRHIAKLLDIIIRQGDEQAHHLVLSICTTAPSIVSLWEDRFTYVTDANIAHAQQAFRDRIIHECRKTGRLKTAETLAKIPTTPSKPDSGILSILITIMQACDQMKHASTPLLSANSDGTPL